MSLPFAVRFPTASTVTLSGPAAVSRSARSYADVIVVPARTWEVRLPAGSYAEVEDPTIGSLALVRRESRSYP